MSGGDIFGLCLMGVIVVASLLLYVLLIAPHDPGYDE